MKKIENEAVLCVGLPVFVCSCLCVFLYISFGFTFCLMLQELQNFERIYHNFEWGLYWPRSVAASALHLVCSFQYALIIFDPIAADNLTLLQPG